MITEGGSVMCVV